MGRDVLGSDGWLARAAGAVTGMASGRGFKLSNEYAALLGKLYTETPKAVFAALAISALTRGELDKAEQAILAEWLTLHENGIVPQAPPVRTERP